MKPATSAIHSGFDHDPETGATAVPLYQTAAYEYATAKELADVFAGRDIGHVYSRISNPTNLSLERRLSELEGGIGAVVTSSGMAAISDVFLGLLSSGDEILASNGIFGGTVSLFRNLLGRFNITTSLADAGDIQAWRTAITPATRILFAETISNPGMDVPDLPALSQLAKEHNIPLVVDATVTTPALARGKDLGADIVIHSTTKFINGHGTAIGGVVIDTGQYSWQDGIFPALRELAKRAGNFAFLAQLRSFTHRDLGGCAAPQNSFLMLQGLETLKARMELHCANALRLALMLEEHEAVAAVDYPGLQTSIYRPRIDQLYGGQGGAVLTFDLCSRETAFRCVDRLQLAKCMTNLGDTRTLVIHPASTIFAEYDPHAREAMGVSEGLIRVSVGIEDWDDINEDFNRALHA